MATVSTTGGLSSFTGLASGMDTSAIVKAMVAQESLPLQRLHDQKTDLTSISTKFTDFKNLLQKLNDTTSSLQQGSQLLSSAATSSDDKAVAVTAAGGAAIGNYDVAVHALASSQRNLSQAYSSHDQPIGLATGKLTIQVGTADAVDLNVDDTTTLDQLAFSINHAGAGVTAVVLSSGADSYLQVSGNATGAANAITFSGSAASELALDSNEIRGAQDASFDIDGLPMTSATNTVTTALPGVTLTLKGLTDNVTVDVTRDNDAIKTKLQSFVDAYNAIATKINGEFAYKGQAQFGNSLSGDSSLRSIQTRLRSLVAGQVTIPGNPSITSLASIGVSTQQDGTLKIDDTKLSSALAQSPEAVSQLLTDQGSGTGVFNAFSKALDDLVSGTGSVIGQRIDSIARQVRTIDAQSTQMQSHIDQYQAMLSAKFASMEAALSTLQGQGSQLTAMLNSLNASKS